MTIQSSDALDPINGGDPHVIHPAEVFSPVYGYDLASSHYESWRWFRFWRLNEAPLVRNWLEGLESGLGLDAGCGTGGYVNEIVASGHHHIGIDLSFRMLLRQEEKSRDLRDSFVSSAQADVRRLPFQSAVFDWVLCTRVLSHLREMLPVLNEFSRVVKSGGECLITDVHSEHPYKYVSIPTYAGEIAIETHKHSIEHLRGSILETDQLEVVSLKEYRLGDLAWKPPKDTFEKIYRNADKPIFYICRVRRR